MAFSLSKKISNVAAKLPHGTAPQGRGFKGVFVSVATDKVERYGAALAFGAAKGYYGEKFVFKGHGADAWIGAGALLVGTLASAFSNGNSKLAPHLERIGDAGVMSALGSLGAAWGMQKAGRSVALLSPGKNVRTAVGPGARQSVVGYIPQAMGGAYLTQDEISRFASAR